MTIPKPSVLDRSKPKKQTNQERNPLTLDVLLSNSCSNPVDWRPYEEYQALVHEWLNSDDPDKGEPPHYDGWMRYDVQLHCTMYEIVARQRVDGTYEIRDYNIQDH